MEPASRRRPPGSLSALRRTNTRRVVDALRGARSLSRAEIARLTGLSRSTVSTVVGDLLETGLLREGAADRPSISGTGRRGVTVSINPSAGAALGIDIAHDGVRAIVADLAGTVLCERVRVLDTASLDPDAIVDAAADTAREALDAAGMQDERLVGCAASVPAPVDPGTGELGAESSIPALAGTRVSRMLSARLGMAVHVENDANLCALAERMWGDRAGHDTMIYVKVSRGVGAGLVVGGRIHRGAHGNAGEIGHTSVAPDGPVCRCGNRGCLELMVGSDALTAAASSRGDEVLPSIDDVVRRALDDDPVARRAIRDVGTLLGQALGAAVNVLNPSLVVVGGELTPAWPILETPLREALDRRAVHRSAEAMVMTPGSLGRRTEALGAVGQVLREGGRVAATGLVA
ncbi:MAG: ROK family transcriptional regulator [Thermoleophilia bacterium]|nr:ROK family transcriptional regulator [Thermoleophilia bacterium]